MHWLPSRTYPFLVPNGPLDAFVLRGLQIEFLEQTLKEKNALLAQVL